MHSISIRYLRYQILTPLAYRELEILIGLKMATQEMAAMLDELMGRNRNANPNEKVNR